MEVKENPCSHLVSTSSPRNSRKEKKPEVQPGADSSHLTAPVLPRLRVDGTIASRVLTPKLSPGKIETIRSCETLTALFSSAVKPRSKDEIVIFVQKYFKLLKKEPETGEKFVIPKITYTATGELAVDFTADPYFKEAFGLDSLPEDNISLQDLIAKFKETGFSKVPLTLQHSLEAIFLLSQIKSQTSEADKQIAFQTSDFQNMVDVFGAETNVQSVLLIMDLLMQKSTDNFKRLCEKSILDDQLIGQERLVTLFELEPDEEPVTYFLHDLGKETLMKLDPAILETLAIRFGMSHFFSKEGESAVALVSGATLPGEEEGEQRVAEGKTAYATSAVVSTVKACGSGAELSAQILEEEEVIKELNKQILAQRRGTPESEDTTSDDLEEDSSIPILKYSERYNNMLFAYAKQIGFQTDSESDEGEAPPRGIRRKQKKNGYSKCVTTGCRTRHIYSRYFETR